MPKFVLLAEVVIATPAAVRPSSIFSGVETKPFAAVTVPPVIMNWAFPPWSGTVYVRAPAWAAVLMLVVVSPLFDAAVSVVLPVAVVVGKIATVPATASAPALTVVPFNVVAPREVRPEGVAVKAGFAPVEPARICPVAPAVIVTGGLPAPPPTTGAYCASAAEEPMADDDE